MQNNTSETAPKRERTAIYTLARIIFGFLFHTIFPLRFHNAQIVEEMQPPYIIMANHRSFADPMALAIKVKRYEIRFIGKRELAHGRLKSWLFSGLHMILVSRHATDMAAMRQCMQTLKEGHILGIFPEGTRHQPRNDAGGGKRHGHHRPARPRAPAAGVYRRQDPPLPHHAYLLWQAHGAGRSVRPGRQ